MITGYKSLSFLNKFILICWIVYSGQGISRNGGIQGRSLLAGRKAACLMEGEPKESSLPKGRRTNGLQHTWLEENLLDGGEPKDRSLIDGRRTKGLKLAWWEENQRTEAWLMEGEPKDWSLLDGRRTKRQKLAWWEESQRTAACLKEGEPKDCSLLDGGELRDGSLMGGEHKDCLLDGTRTKGLQLAWWE